MRITVPGGRYGPILAVFQSTCRTSTMPLELVPQHQQFDVFHMQATAATNKRAKQGPKSEVEEGEDHAADPPNLAVAER
jgi:hypothetical protein